VAHGSEPPPRCGGTPLILATSMNPTTCHRNSPLGHLLCRWRLASPLRTFQKRSWAEWCTTLRPTRCLPQRSYTLAKIKLKVSTCTYDTSSELYEVCVIIVSENADERTDEELIKFGYEEDVWFHVDNLSSAHVYLRLPEGQSWENVDQSLLVDCAQLTKANSIEGRLYSLLEGRA
jgi:hypothetical protein